MLTEQRPAITQEEIDDMLQRRQELEEEDQLNEQRFQALSYLSQSCNWVRDELEKPDMRAKISTKDLSEAFEAMQETLKWYRERDNVATLEEVQEKQLNLESVVDPIFERAQNSFKSHRESQWARPTAPGRRTRRTIRSQTTRAALSRAFAEG